MLLENNTSLGSVQPYKTQANHFQTKCEPWHWLRELLMFESWEYFRTIDEAIQLYIPKGHTLRLYGSFAVGKLEHTVVSTSLKSSGFGGHFIQLKKKITSLTIHSICRPSCSTFFSNVSQHRGFWWQRESPLTRHHNSPLTESRQRAEIAVRVNALMIRPKLKHNSVVHRTERHL